MHRVSLLLAHVTGMLATLAIVIPAVHAGMDAEVLSSGIVVRQTPDFAAPGVATLSAGTAVSVVFTQRGPGGEWTRIILASGEEGFVPASSLRRLNEPPSWREAHRAGPEAREEQGKNGSAIRLRRAGSLLLVPARINGQVDTLLVVDTGASGVLISESLSERLGITRLGPRQAALSANGVHYVRPTVLESIHLPDESGVCAHKIEAAVGELTGFPRDIGGLLGQSFLRRFHVAIDAERLLLHLDPLSSVKGRTAGQ